MNKNPDVDAYFNKLENPMKGLWKGVRDIVLSVNPKIEEA